MGNLLTGLVTGVVNKIVAQGTGFLFNFFLNSLLGPFVHIVYEGGASMIVYETLKATYPAPEFVWGLVQSLVGQIFSLLGLYNKLFRDKILTKLISLLNPATSLNFISTLLGWTIQVINLFKGRSARALAGPTYFTMETVSPDGEC